MKKYRYDPVNSEEEKSGFEHRLTKLEPIEDELFIGSVFGYDLTNEQRIQRLDRARKSKVHFQNWLDHKQI